MKCKSQKKAWLGGGRFGGRASGGVRVRFKDRLRQAGTVEGEGTKGL